MNLFKAKDGSLINPSNVNLVRRYKEEGSWVVKFDFVFSAREIIFNSEKDANAEMERFEAHCA
jgi:hypothetical protein